MAKKKSSPIPEHMQPPPKGPKRYRFTHEEAAHHRRVVNELLVRLYHPDRIVQTMRTNFQVSKHRSLRLIQEELEKWDREGTDVNDVKRKRVAAEQRLATYLEECRKRFFNPTATVKGSMRDIMMVEKQLAEIQGTLAPIKVDINVSITANMAAVLANLSPEQIQAALDRQKALRQAAQVAVQSNLLLPEVEETVKPILVTEAKVLEEKNNT